MKFALLLLGLLASIVIFTPQDAKAVTCARGVYRAGCVGPHGAVGVRRAPYVRRAPVVVHRSVYRRPVYYRHW